jgi:hypothetical protein
MKYSCVGVPSGSKASTYHENKDSVNQSSLPDRTYMTKRQLNKLIDIIEMEKNKALSKIRELETKNHFLENDNRRLRTEVIDNRMQDIKEYRQSKDAFMQIAI